MSELKCPFCQQELKEDVGYDGDYSCPNCTEPYFGSPELWQELIRTRKELDIRKKQVEIANKAFDFINTEWDNIDCSRKELGACAFNAKEDISGWESDIETALEQKEHFADASKTIKQKDVKCTIDLDLEFGVKK